MRYGLFFSMKLSTEVFFFFSGIFCDESPTFSNDLNNLVLPENTAVGTVIGTLKRSDPEGFPVHYGIEGTDLLSADADSGDVKLVKPFDREVMNFLSFEKPCTIFKIIDSM